MIVEERYIPSSLYATKSPYSMIPEYITIHNTANDASAENEYTYMTRTNASSTTGWHIVVDDVKAIYAVPLNRNSFHAGDGGSGTGNRKSIGIEICYSKSGGDRYYKAEENCVQLVASLLKKYGWGVDRLRKHQDWSGKYCPHRILDEGTWDKFKERVYQALNGVPSQPITPTNSIIVGSHVKINTINPYNYYVADDVQFVNGMYQICEYVNAGGKARFDWTDNGIPEKCVDLVDEWSQKREDSDKVHVKKGDKFVFNCVFTVKKVAVDKGVKYYQLDYDNNPNHRFWVIGSNLMLV